MVVQLTLADLAVRVQQGGDWNVQTARERTTQAGAMPADANYQKAVAHARTCNRHDNDKPVCWDAAVSGASRELGKH
jgi:hypothetical protein